ncbi:MAG: phenylacetate--CoA ligase family protein [Candidatus Syntropharchaeia archaeon]
MKEKKLQATIKLAYEKSPFYRRRFKEAGIVPSDIKNYDDLVKLPFMSKEDIVRNYKSVICDKVSVYHTTSGTSGIPTVIGFSKNDVEVQISIEKRNLLTVGIGEDDIVHNTTPYGMFFAGIDLHEAARDIGATVIPAGKLLTAKQQVEIINRFEPTAILGIPQYILKLGYAYEEILGKDPRESSLKKAYLLGEPLPDSMRKRIEDLWGIETRQGYGLSEAGSAAECEELNGLHWPNDHTLVEVIDRETGERVSPGEEGELVYTTITRTGTVVIRFRSNDISHIIPDECSCGRKTVRIAPIKYRFDDLCKIRGTLTSPYTIDEVIFRYDGVRNYLCVVEKDERGVMDRMKIYIESDRRDPKVIAELYEKLGGGICVNPDEIKYVEKGMRPQIGRKEKRFIDLRKENPYKDIVREFMEKV